MTDTIFENDNREKNVNFTDTVTMKSNEYTHPSDGSALVLSTTPNLPHGPFIHFTKWSTDSRGPIARFPVMMSKNFRVDVASTTYLRELYDGGYAQQTVEQYAKILLDFLTLMHNSKINVFDVTEDQLKKWREYLTKRRGITVTSFKAYIGVVLNFYWSAQKNGFTTLMIGRNDREKGIIFRINVLPSTGKSGKVYLGTPLREGTNEAQPPIVPPTPEAIEAVKIAVADTPTAWVARRNGLLLDWLQECGMRRDEAMHLPLSSIPTMDELDDLVDAGKPIVVTLHHTKGMKKRDIEVSTGLMARTRNWIDFDRNEVVEAKIAAGTLEEDAGLVFISSKTGKGLSAQAFTNLVAASAKKAGYSGVSPHPFRHRHATDVLVQRIRSGMDVDTALLWLKDRLGHALLVTTQRYTHLGRAEMERPTMATEKSRVQDEQAAQDQLLKDLRRDSLKLAKGSNETESAVRQLVDLVEGGISIEDIKAALATIGAAQVSGGANG